MTIAVVGEVLIDLVWPIGTDRIVPHPGGSPANVAVGLHRLGVLAGVELAEHQKFSIPFLFGASVVMTIASVVFGVFPL